MTDRARKRNRYDWPLRAESMVRDAKQKKLNSVAVVRQLHREFGFPEHACWRFVGAFGFSRPTKYKKRRPEEIEKILRAVEQKPIRQVAKYQGTTEGAIYQLLYRMGRAVSRRGTAFGLTEISRRLGVKLEQVKQWVKDGKLQAQVEQHGSITATLVSLEELERFCLEEPYELVKPGKRGPRPLRRFEFMIRFGLAAKVPDDRTAQSHRRERLAAASAGFGDDRDDEDDRDEVSDRDQAAA
jgi:hypothetical protein